MSQEKLPAVPLYKNTLENREKMMIMGQHRRKLYEICRKKAPSGERVNSTISYRDLLEDNPKKNYLLEAKYTEIERENRALF